MNRLEYCSICGRIKTNRKLIHYNTTTGEPVYQYECRNPKCQAYGLRIILGLIAFSCLILIGYIMYVYFINLFASN